MGFQPSRGLKRMEAPIYFFGIVPSLAKRAQTGQVGYSSLPSRSPVTTRSHLLERDLRQACFTATFSKAAESASIS